MRCYWITGHPASVYEQSQYRGTMAEAHACAKEAPRDYRDGVRVEEVEIDDSKAGVLRILNDGGQYQTVLRTFKFGPRGGLVETELGE